MAQFVKKENLTISTGEYQKDGQTKKEWRTIGELVTMIGDDGKPYQFFKMWGAGGVVEGKVFEQRDNNQAPQQAAQQYNQAPQYQQPQQQPQQPQYSQAQQQPQQPQYSQAPHPQQYNGG